MNELEALLCKLGYGQLEMVENTCDMCDFRKVIVYAKEAGILSGAAVEMCFYQTEDNITGRESTLKAACLLVVAV